MAVKIAKGEKVSLSKGKTVKKVLIGLGWDTNKYSGGFDFDLDASVFLLSANGRAMHDVDFVFYNNLVGPNQSVKHMGDNLTGEGDGDDEQITVDFDMLPNYVEDIRVTVTIHEAAQRQQNFGQVSNAYVHVTDMDTNEELVRYNLGEDFSVETAVVVASLAKEGRNWKFEALGEGVKGDLATLCTKFGIDAE